MSCTVSTVQIVDEIPGHGRYMAVAADGMVTLWPAGVGEGPSITMSVGHWHRQKREADLAIMAMMKRADAEGFNANEGCG